MLCKKCGNEINDGAEFCNHCGSPVEQSDQKKEKKSGNIIVRIGVIIAAFLIARLVIAPIITRSYQDNDDNGDQPSGNSNVGIGQQIADDDLSYDGVLKTNVYEFEEEGIMTSEFYVVYADGDIGSHKDGAVISINGFYTLQDMSLIDNFRYTHEGIKNMVDSAGISDASCDYTETTSSYSVRYAFNNLDGEGRSDAVILASRALFGSAGDADTISEVHRKMLEASFTLAKEY